MTHKTKARILLFIHEICSIPLETVTQPTITWLQVFIVFHAQKMDLQRVSLTLLSELFLSDVMIPFIYKGRLGRTYTKEIGKVMELKYAHGYIEFIFL